METNKALLLFWKFLAHRVRAENLDVLYRIAVDFLVNPPCFTRVEEMIYRVYPTVAILPTEITDSSLRAKADKLLKRMREQEIDRNDESAFSDVHVALSGRIQLKNWDVLEQIFREFTMGRERTLRAFVALQPEAIVILPTAPSSSKTPDAVGRELASVVSSETSVLGDALKPDPGERQDLEPCIPELPLKPCTRFQHDTPPAIYEMVRVIRAELDAIEVTAPWDQVYDVSKIAYPFDETKHEVLAERFARFWSRHARAVWQRRFWCRLSANERHGAYNAQKVADKSASKAFMDMVLKPISDTFGSAFFVELDARSARLHWWWYQEPLVDLVHMASVKGVGYCRRYLRTQHMKQQPTPHTQLHRKTTHRVSPREHVVDDEKHEPHPRRDYPTARAARSARVA